MPIYELDGQQPELPDAGQFYIADTAVARTSAGTRVCSTALSSGQLAPWAEATQGAKRAEAMLARPEVGTDLRREIQDLVATVARERDQATFRANIVQAAAA